MRHPLLPAASLAVLASLLTPFSSWTLEAYATATFEVAPGFLPDPQSLSGTASGDRNVRSIQGVPETCTGWAGRVPDARIRVQHTLPWMRLEVSASRHFSLLMRSPGGNWECVSRDGPRSARMDLTWSRGHYEVYVVVAEQGESLPYTLQVTERRLPSTTRSLSPAQPSGPTLWLTSATLREGLRASGVSEEGRQQTPQMSPHGPCIGRLSEAPSHLLEVESPLERVTLRVRSQADTMLRLENRETGQIFCNDDTFGLDPYLDLPMSPGRWDLHIGTVLGEPAPYTLEILAQPSEHPPRTQGSPRASPEPTPDAPPPTDSDRTSNFGDAVVGDALPPEGLRLEGISGGEEDTQGLRGMDGTPCEGMIHERPDHLLILQATHDLDRLQVRSDAAVSLVVDGPSGVQCAAADADGAQLQGPWPAGTYRVYLGSVTPGYHPYVLYLLPPGASPQADPNVDPN